MTDADDEHLRQRVEELEHRLERIEEIFAPNLLDRQTKHLDAQERDAREVLSPGEEEAMRVISPEGEGQDPGKCVGKIHGVVTFAENGDTDIDPDKGDSVDVLLHDVRHSVAEGEVLGPHDEDEDE